MMVMLQRFWLQMTSDRKRFGMLCGAVALGLLLWARLIIVSKMPRTAVAEPDASILSSAPADAAAPTASTDNTQRPVVSLTIVPTGGRDPFRINRDFFPKPTTQPASTQEAGKSRAEPVESPEQQEARRVAQILAHVERLRLDAVMTGQGMAVISGTLYRLNAMIPSTDNPNLAFKLVEVRTRSVVLEVEGKVYELEMNISGGAN